MISVFRCRAAVVIPLVFLGACERVARSESAIVDRSAVVPSLAISVSRDDIAYMVEHDVSPMIGTGRCGSEEASVWYMADVVGENGKLHNDLAEVLRDDGSQRFTLVATMEYPTPAMTDDCGFLTTVGYSLHGLAGRALPLHVVNRQ